MFYFILPNLNFLNTTNPLPEDWNTFGQIQVYESTFLTVCSVKSKHTDFIHTKKHKEKKNRLVIVYTDYIHYEPQSVWDTTQDNSWG